MKILFIGEASYLHNTLRKGIIELGHKVTIASDGNSYHDSYRDIDIHRNMRWGKLGGILLLIRILLLLPRLKGYDIVQLVHPAVCIPLRPRLVTWIIRYWLKPMNKCLIMGCNGDDSIILERQSSGVLAYCDTYWNGTMQNVQQNRERLVAAQIPEVVRNNREVALMADALTACLYEYYLCYNISEYGPRLHYMPLPMDGIADKRPSDISGNQRRTIKVLIGIQPKRDYMKGARRIADFLHRLDSEQPGLLEITEVTGVPYDEYCRLLEETDILVDQLYSYTPSMNSLAAMARGTVVIGGGEEEYYRFINEKSLRPIINVRPDASDEENIAVLRKALFTPGNIERLSSESIEFVRRYHDYRLVAKEHIKLYENLLSIKQ